MSRPPNVRSFELSWVTFVLALATGGAIPLVLWLNDDRRPGWDQLSEQLTIVLGGLIICVVFLTVSFIASIRAVKQRKLVLLWMIPSGIVVVTVFGYLLALLVATAVAPFWQSGWL